MVYFLAIVLGFLSGLMGAYVFSKMSKKVIPSIPIANVVKKQGPSLYSVEKRRKPKSSSERELWEKENKQKLI